MRRAERKAVSPLVIGAAITPRMANTPPTAPSQSFVMASTIMEAFVFFHANLMEKVSGGGSPNQSYDAFRLSWLRRRQASVSFTCHAACHERTLSSMKTTDCTTSYTDKHNREDRQQGSIGMCILQAVPYFGQRGMVDIEHHQNTDSLNSKAMANNGYILPIILSTGNKVARI